jgi:hypothetical protein
MKKYVLAKVISQMMIKSMRPMQRAPRVGFSAFPTEALLEFPALREVGDGNRVEYIIAFSECKRVLASIISCRGSFYSERALNHSRATPQRRIDEFFCFE